ncbi:hypothetical protein BS47DRAFT_1011246 [Hydnum rufescens UP504]|uniref:DUF6532 domain-containing protein n=1 Tax=Hydnum rufescens UP504 TaxID=1448309 RepID=A0A9P6AVY5_9AGAM|nr:hypothetical protein BS47DRAFT_1011246 [Hydnum rufescens UP504]
MPHTQGFWRNHQDPRIWSVMEPALHSFHFLMLMGDIFGNHMVMRKYVGTVFETAFKSTGIDPFEITSPMVTTSISSFHSRFKDVAQICVQSLYGFDTLESPEEISAIVRGALYEENFSFRIHNAEEGTRSDALHHPCIFQVMRTYFAMGKKTPKQAKIVHSFMDAFIPMPPEPVAFALTMIQNTLHRWETGREANIELSAEKYRPYYEGHLDWIKAWGKKHSEEWDAISAELGDAAAAACGYTTKSKKSKGNRKRVLKDDD